MTSLPYLDLGGGEWPPLRIFAKYLKNRLANLHETLWLLTLLPTAFSAFFNYGGEGGGGFLPAPQKTQLG